MTKKTCSDCILYRYVFFVFFELVMCITGIISTLNSYKLYENPLLFYFLLYNISISIISVLHFMKLLYDLYYGVKNDVPFVKIKTLLLLSSFIWGMFILGNHELMNFYENNYSITYYGFINYFVVTCVNILIVICKIIYFIYEKNNGKIDYSILYNIEDEFNDRPLIELTDINNDVLLTIENEYKK